MIYNKKLNPQNTCTLPWTDIKSDKLFNKAPGNSQIYTSN